MRLFQIVVFKLNNCHLAHTVHTSGKFCKAWILHFRKWKRNPCTTIPLDSLYLDVFCFFGQVPCCLLKPKSIAGFELPSMNYFFTEQALLSFYTSAQWKPTFRYLYKNWAIYWDEILFLSTHKKSCSNLLSLHCKLLPHGVDQSVDAIQAKDYC